MNARPEILFLCHRIPFPPNKGDKIRSWHLLKHLARRGDVHLACFIDNKGDWRHTEYVREQCASAHFVPLRWGDKVGGALNGLATNRALSLAYYDRPDMRMIVDNLRQRPLAVEFAFSSLMAQYLEREKTNTPRIVDLCDADSLKWRDYSLTTNAFRRVIFQREYQKLRKEENNIVEWADASFAITPEEAEQFNRRLEVSRAVDWWANGVDSEFFDPAQVSDTAPAHDIIFTGMMDYRPNIGAITSFVRNVWPNIRAMRPDTTFAIVGANPSREVLALGSQDGITVTGRVDDIRPWIKYSRVAIAPLAIARGMQNKVLEALAMATPVVASPAAAVGINIGEGDGVITASNNGAMVREILMLLQHGQAQKDLGAKARLAISERYQWSAQLARFDTVFNCLLSGQSKSETSGSTSDAA